MGQLALFDYDQLEQIDRDFIQGRTNEIKAAQDIIDIGAMLIEVKERLPHGMFYPWLDAEFRWKEHIAAGFIRVAKKFESKNLVLLDFEPCVFNLLTAPSIPDEAREEALDRAAQGETLTCEVAEEIIEKHKQSLF